MQGDKLLNNSQLVEKLQALAANLGCSAGQVALAWLYKRAADLGVSMVAIPGTKRVKYLLENVAALDVSLRDEDYEDLCHSFVMVTSAPDAVAGGRCGVPHLMYAKK
jgi:aryl-alcohol dehydrogenase-like predicted oxidoreductase